MSMAFKRGWVSASYNKQHPASHNKRNPYPAWTRKWAEWCEGWNAFQETFV